MAWMSRKLMQLKQRACQRQTGHLRREQLNHHHSCPKTKTAQHVSKFSRHRREIAKIMTMMTKIALMRGSTASHPRWNRLMKQLQF